MAIFDLMYYDNDNIAGKGTNFCNILDRKPLYGEVFGVDGVFDRRN
jgi:hypothetical protein